jgi:hypothetical protein
MGVSAARPGAAVTNGPWFQSEAAETGLSTDPAAFVIRLFLRRFEITRNQRRESAKVAGPRERISDFFLVPVGGGLGGALGLFYSGNLACLDRNSAAWPIRQLAARAADVVPR